MQRAAILKEINKFPEIEDFPDEEPKDNEVLIEQNKTGICYRDILTMKGFFPRVTLPIVPGHEISGKVVKIGKNVTKFKVGDRVSSLIYVPCGKCEYCLSGRENLCRNKRTFGESLNGAYKKYIRVPEISLVKVPDGVGEEEAVIAACVTGMLIQAMRVNGGLSEGQWVLVTGAGGGVGSHAVQISKAYGAKVIAETSSPWKKELLEKLGADYVIEKENMERKVKEITGDGVHLALESVGRPTFNEAFRSLRFGGSVVVVGNVDVTPVNLPLGNLILKGNKVIGSISSTKRDMEEALRLSKEGKIKAIVGKKFDLNNVKEAYEAMDRKEIFGRAFLKL